MIGVDVLWVIRSEVGVGLAVPAGDGEIETEFLPLPSGLMAGNFGLGLVHEEFTDEVPTLISILLVEVVAVHLNLILCR